MAEVPILLLVLVTAAYCAPNQLKYETLRPSLDRPKPSDPVENNEAEATRTLVTVTILSWIMNILKAMVKPARDMYLWLSPEISAVRCLSESREVQNMFGYNLDSSDDNFEGYFYESPRSSSGGSDLGNDRLLKRIPRFINEVSSLLTDGGTMSCIAPYMRERVVRWLDG